MSWLHLLPANASCETPVTLGIDPTPSFRREHHLGERECSRLPSQETSLAKQEYIQQIQYN